MPVLQRPQLGPSGTEPGSRPPSAPPLSLPPSHSHPCCAQLLGARSTEGLRAPRPAPTFAFNGSAPRLILFSSGFSLPDESRVGLRDQEVPLASPSWARPPQAGLPLPSQGGRRLQRELTSPGGGLPPLGFGSEASGTPPLPHPSPAFCLRPFKAASTPPSLWGPIAPSGTGGKNKKILTKCHFFQKHPFVNIR